MRCPLAHVRSAAAALWLAGNLCRGAGEIARSSRDSRQADSLHVGIDSGSAASAASALGLRRGDVFLRRFALLERLGGGALAAQAPGFFPDALKESFADAAALGHGGFGESWLARDRARGQQLVVKVLYVNEEGGPRHLTWDMTSASERLRADARRAARECDVAKALHVNDKHPGAGRVMNCYGHNVPEGDAASGGGGSEPLYLMLEHCGKQNLRSFLEQRAEQGTLSAALVTSLFKQTLEGLSLLSSFDPPWIHHDLKPQNLIVREEPDGTATLHLIDFGEAVKAERGRQCERTASSFVYAPPEWHLRVPGCKEDANFDLSCGHCAGAFDIFPAGSIFLEMISGKRLWKLPGVLYTDAQAKKRLNYTVVQELVDSPAQLAAALDPDPVYMPLAMPFLDPKGEGHGFFQRALKMLSAAPAARPTADELLGDGYLQRTAAAGHGTSAVQLQQRSRQTSSDQAGAAALAAAAPARPAASFARLRDVHQRRGPQ